jgi:ferredoxin
MVTPQTYNIEVEVNGMKISDSLLLAKKILPFSCRDITACISCH